MTTQQEALTAAGRALYGENWMPGIACDIDATVDEVRAHAEGKPVPSDDWSEIEAALLAKLIQIQEARDLVAAARTR